MKTRNSLAGLRAGASVLTILAAGATTGAVAQGGADNDDSPVIEEIIVSAQKRDERQRDVPISITAYSQDFLNSIGVDDFGELSEITPGVNVQLQSPNNPSFVIRGITSDDGSAQQSPRVTVFYNGVDVSRARGSAFELFDLERIEILKGPQATLFGAAAEIGAFSVISARPEKEFSAEFYAGYGNFDYVKTGGYVTGGNDQLQGRFAFQFRRRDGFVDNLAGLEGSQSPVGPVAGDLNGLETFSVRPSLRFTPNDDLTIDFIFTYEQNDQPGTAFLSAVIPPSSGVDLDANDIDGAFGELSGAFANNLLSFGGLEFNPLINGLAPVLTPVSDQELADLLGRDELGLFREIIDFNLSVDWDINDTWQLSSIIGYREFDSREVFDADGSQVPFLEIGEISEGEQFNFELRAAFDYDGIRGFFGFNYFTEDNSQSTPAALDESIFLACLSPVTAQFNPAQCVNSDGSFNRLNILTGALVPSGSAPGILNITDTTNTGEFNVFSFFADTTIEVTEKLEVTGGVRFIFDDVESGVSTFFQPSAAIFLQLLQAGVLGPDQFDQAPFLQPVAISTNNEFVTQDDNFSAVLPRFNVLYKVNDDLNLFGTISRGRKRPALTISNLDNDFDGQLDANLLSEEIVWNYEAGFKALFLDGRAELSASVFYQDYENFIVSIVESTQAGIIFNSVDAGNATNVGIEVGGRAQVNNNIGIFGTFAWIDAEIDDEPENGIFAGNTFRLTPEFSASAGFNTDYEIDASHNFFFNGSWTFRSSVFFEEANVPIAGIPITEGAVNQVDIRGGIRNEEEGWEISGFVTNLFNEDFNIDGGNTGGGFGLPTFIPGEPRFYGVEFKISY